MTTLSLCCFPCGAAAAGRRLGLALALAAVLSCSAPTAAAQRAPALAEAAFAEAFSLYTQRLYDPALEAFSAFYTANPEHISAPDALYYQAEVSLLLGREDDAVRLFRTFQQRYPAHPLAFQARLALGKYFYETQDYERALTTLAQVVDDDAPPETAAKALYWMGESALNLGRDGDAMGYFQRAADRYRATTTAPIALYAIAFTEVRRGRYDEAARAFELLAARHPESPYARDIGLALAEVYYELGDYSRTVSETLRRLSNLSGEALERATFLLAESYNQLRDSQNAIIYYRRITEDIPNSPYYRRAVFGLAWNYYFEGVHQWAAEQFELARRDQDDDLAARATYYEAVNRKLAQDPMRAIALFREMADRWPDHELADHALFELGVAYYEQRLWDDANTTFGRLLDRYPDSALTGEALNLHGNTFIALNNFESASRAFDQAIALDAASPELKQEIAFQKAWLMYRNGNYATAAPAFTGLYDADPSGPRAGAALFWSAESVFQNGDLAGAVQRFQQYLQAYPTGEHTDAAYYALGWAHFKQSRYTQAIDAFNQFLRAYQGTSEFVPYRTDALLRLGDSYYALKRYPEAVRTYQQVADSGEDYALYQTAQALSNVGDTFEAITMFRSLLTDYPGSEWREESMYSLGYLYFLNQDFDQAITEYRRLIVAAPNEPLAAKAQYGVGDAFFNAGRLEEAVTAYQEVLTRYPNSPFAADAASGIQFALIALGDEARAAQIIEDFAAANPNAPVVDELRFRLAEVKYQSGQVNEALGDFQRFIRSARNTTLLPEAYYYLGSIYSERGQGQEAESYLKQLLTAYPQSDRRADAAQQLGQIYLDQDRHQDALATFRTMESASGGNARLVALARYGQSVALLSMGRTGEAERLLQESIASAPDAAETAPALLGLARLYEQEGRTADARTLYLRVVDRSRDGTGAEALVRLGGLLLNQGNARAAIEELGRLDVLFAGYPQWQAQGYLVQARAFTRLGQIGDATQVYDKIISTFSDTPYAAVARREKAAL